MPRVLLIDDEPPAREDMARLLAMQPGVVVVGEAGSVAAARIQLAEQAYDLVFLDIQLVGGTGFDLVADVRPGARIIFVTAHDEHAMRAFEVNALDYLLKPVRAARLTEALQRLPGVPAVPTVALRPDDLVHLQLSAQQSRIVALARIAAVRSCENYSEVLLVDGTRHLVRQTMKAWEERLPVSHFARVHRHVIAGLAHYRGMDYVPQGTSRLHLAGVTEPLPASYRYVPELRGRLEALGVKI